MYAKPQRTIDKGLSKFKLIAGQGDGSKTACAMTMLGWLAGHKKWNDHPVCADDTLANIVIEANDSSDGDGQREQRMRANLVKLGYEGVLDTWWIPAEVISWLTDREQVTSYKYAVAILKATAKWKQKRFKVMKVDGKFAAKYQFHVLNKSTDYPGDVWVKVS